MRFHIYLGDTCIGDIDASDGDNALIQYALRTGMANVIGLTPILVPLSVLQTGSN